MLKRLLLAAFSTAFSLAVVELGMRVLGAFPPLPHCGRPELYQPYEPHGYRLWPSISTTYRYPRHNPRTLTVVSNKAGFRSRRELEEADPRPRIVVLGDSFVFGEGVEQEERFPNVLEKLRPGWRVDNLGMTGYGLDLMLRALEHVGLPTRPSHVLVAVYTDDFRRIRPRYAGVGFEIPRFELVDGALVTRPYPPRPWYENIHLAQALFRATRRGPYRPKEARPAEERALNQAILERIVAVSRAGGAGVSIIFLPGKIDSPMDKERRQWLRGFAEDHGTHFADLTDPIHQAGKAAFITRNWHYNPYGHEIVARHVAKLLDGVIPTRSLPEFDRPM